MALPEFTLLLQFTINPTQLTGVSIAQFIFMTHASLQTIKSQRSSLLNSIEEKIPLISEEFRDHA
jgi:hypothetical protein